MYILFDYFLLYLSDLLYLVRGNQAIKIVCDTLSIYIYIYIFPTLFYLSLSYAYYVQSGWAF